MTSVCFYFQVHQPFRIKPFHFFDIGEGQDYNDDDKNRAIMRKVGEKCYIPTTDILYELTQKFKGKFKVSFSLSGIFIDQARLWYPEVLDNFKRLADTGQVEFLSETYYHSLSSLISENEFHEQVKRHADLIQKEFGQKPTVFRNTELIFSNHIAWLTNKMGFKGMLLEGSEKVLGWRQPNYVYKAKYVPELKLLLKNYKLSDDIAFRFSEKSWKEFPLTTEKFSHWVHNIAGDGNVVNLFMDFETFGEHQWADSGIFEFLRHLPEQIYKHPDFEFATLSEAIGKYEPVGEIDTHDPISWADIERDLSAWLGNNMQNEAFRAIYDLEKKVYATKDAELLETFRRLQTSDHFYYMCTKYFNDGDVHKYFNPFDSPYDAYIYYMNILQDFRQKIDEHPGKKVKPDLKLEKSSEVDVVPADVPKVRKKTPKAAKSEPAEVVKNSPDIIRPDISKVTKKTRNLAVKNRPEKTLSSV
jgi:alpha-amylase